MANVKHADRNVRRRVPHCFANRIERAPIAYRTLAILTEDEAAPNRQTVWAQAYAPRENDDVFAYRRFTNRRA
jgi:hypothetical protein